MPHIKWPSVESFHNVRKAVRSYPHICSHKFKVTYRGKIKLHGSNSCVQIVRQDNAAPPAMEVLAQSRTRLITPENDNMGFAAWVKEHEELWKSVSWTNARILSLGDVASPNVQSICIFGEWSGPGVQKNTALNMLKEKIFAVFGIMLVVDGEELPVFHGDERLIRTIVPNIPNTYVLPWHGEPIEVNWAMSTDELAPTVELLNKAVDEVEKCDPWVKDTFGVEGIGEGVVYFPVSSDHLGRKAFSDLAFKAKGEKHKVVKQKRPVQVDPEVVSSTNEFVELVVTEPRLEQGVTEACGGEYTMKKMGSLIGWATKDVHKECQAELEASGLEWKQVSKAVSNKARAWYMRRISET